nr:hypothetical protein [Nocardia neocaledoniensis]
MGFFVFFFFFGPRGRPPGGAAGRPPPPGGGGGGGRGGAPPPTAIWAGGRSACADAPTTLCDGPAKAAVLLAPAVILLLGGLGAFVRTYLAWRRGQSWPLWQGAGWFLFLLMTVYLGVGAGAAA